MVLIKILIGGCASVVLILTAVAWSLYRKRHIFEFAKNFNSFKFYPILGNYLQLRHTADAWRVRRKFFSKSFSQPILNSYVHYFYSNSNVLLDVFRNGYDDLFNVFRRYSFDSFCEIIVGKNYNLQTETSNKLLEEMDVIQKYMGDNFTIGSSFGYIFQLKEFVANGWSVILLLNKIKSFLSNMVDFRETELKKCPVIDSKLSFLDAMLTHSDLFLPSVTCKELNIFVLAATDTTGTALTFTFTLLGMYPEIQEKVYEEVITEIGRNTPIETDHLPKLKFTERVLLESMRILPPVPVVGRYITKDIKVGDKIFPKGANVFIYVLALHHNSKYWPNPEKFDPDRFLPDEIANRSPYCYIPFSGGPRNCIGKTYAMMSMKVAVANVIRNFKISSKYKSIDEMEMTSFITMRTKHDIDCHFSPRT
ncbi:cytochrome P450 4C1 isoform X3 [Sitophilus oryzae]|uniref:Cytochrome P450 4C1 isoform X3 n=1 Tax=Sitophilus oryzae TaxID=7048 RepID=A0A6J2XNW9_SITOR|nr:cytochrome P450 4C1 isoform X3 [Sitophilus oryzae]